MKFGIYFLLFIHILKCCEAKIMITSGEPYRSRNVQRRNMIGSMKVQEPQKKSAYGVIEIGPKESQPTNIDVKPKEETEDPDKLEELVHKIGQLMLYNEKQNYRHHHFGSVPKQKIRKTTGKNKSSRSKTEAQEEKLAADLLKAARSRGKRNAGMDSFKNGKGTLLDREAALERVLDPIQNADSALEQHKRKKRN